ncbi:MAG: ABC transporter permease [Planctomycetota bacterium]|nr:MAG: ABC transporter permease [Planctomycetota bacterium]REJ88306.1 MAG: ABC transporter permease [Planctomycetota bacterium]
MLRFIPYLLKTIWRHRARTILTVSGTAVAMFVFCFVGAVQEGMSDLTHRREARQSLITFQTNKFCPATSRLPQDYDAKIRQVDGVRDVVPIQVFTNNCRATLDAVVFYGLPAEKLQAIRNFRLIEGDWADFETRQDAALVGRAVAARRGRQRGDSFRLGELTVHVAGVYESSDPAEENYIYTHLDFLQRHKGQNQVGTVTQFETLLADGADAEAVGGTIDEMLLGGTVATDTRPKGVFQARNLGDLKQLIDLSHLLAFACVGLVLALVGTTTLMAVQDRVKEHAVLQTIGFTGGRVFGLVLMESLILSAIGGLVGVGAATIVLWGSDLTVYTEAVSVAFRPSLTMMLTGLAVALVVGLLAGLAPARAAARAEIVPALRQG